MNAGMNAGMNTVVASTVVASTAAEWRAWLERNGRSEKEVWLVVHHKDSGTPSVRYHEAIEHALCYGWIDGLHRTRDADSSQLRFTPRRPRSTWSRVNRLRAATMIERGLMTEHGQAMIDLARVGGTWAVPGDEEGSVLPTTCASRSTVTLAAVNLRANHPSTRGGSSGMAPRS